MDSHCCSVTTETSMNIHLKKTRSFNVNLTNSLEAESANNNTLWVLFFAIYTQFQLSTYFPKIHF